MLWGVFWLDRGSRRNRLHGETETMRQGPNLGHLEAAPGLWEKECQKELGEKELWNQDPEPPRLKTSFRMGVRESQS